MPPAAATVTVTNVALTTANTGYSWEVPANCRGFSIQARTAVDLKIGITQANVESGGTNYATIKAGTVFSSPFSFASANQTFWFSSGSSSIVLEVLYWT